MSVPEVRLGAVRRPGGVQGVEDRVVAEQPIADLVQDENLLLVGKVDHLPQSARARCSAYAAACAPDAG